MSKKIEKPVKKKLISFRVEHGLHRALRVRAAENENTIEAEAAEAIRKHLGAVS